MGATRELRGGMPQNLGLPERYAPIRRLASGGMATVWCAHDRTLDRNVAIKLLSERFAHHPEAVRRFTREARAAARLSGHPNVVTIYDVGRTEPPERRAFIVMEHLPGGTVADAIRLGALTRRQAVRWLHEAAAALDYAHAQGVLHRDVKPANMLLSRDRALHLADFGIARVPAEDTLTGSGEVFGTASYLAPERALGHPATAASDRYSLAVAAYELLAGRRPFTPAHYAAQARAHVEAQPPAASRINPELPRELDAVLARGLAKHPQDRWPTARALADAVEAALADSRRPAGGWRRRTPALAALAAAALGVGIAAAANTEHERATTAAAPVVHHAAAKPRPRAPARHRHPRPAPVKAVTVTRAVQSSQAPGADSLEAQGHQLMEQGQYTQAVGVLHHALAAAPQGTLTYAYALYDLGRSLRLAGDPRAAIPVLWQRMQIPNQTEAVREELQRALEQEGSKLTGPHAARSGGVHAPRRGAAHARPRTTP